MAITFCFGRSLNLPKYNLITRPNRGFAFWKYRSVAKRLHTELKVESTFVGFKFHEHVVWFRGFIQREPVATDLGYKEDSFKVPTLDEILAINCTCDRFDAELLNQVLSKRLRIHRRDTNFIQSDNIID